MEIKIKNIEDLISLLTWSLDGAPVLSDELLEKSNQFLSETQSNFTITEDGELSDDIDDSKQFINYKIAEYLLNEFDEIIVTEHEKLIGIKSNKRVELYDGTDQKLYLDASML